MRQFVLGIIATVAGGFLLFWVTNWYASWANPNKFDIEYQADVAAAFLGETEIAAFQSFLKSPDYNSGKIAVVRIENKSSDSIRNAKFIISPTEENLSKSNMHGFGLASFLDGDMPDPTMRTIEGGIEVLFPLLEEGNGAYFWIAHEPPQGFRLFSDAETLDISEVTRWDQEDFLPDFAFVFLIGLVCLILGVVMGNALSESIIKKAGYDPKKISADYYRSLASDEEKKANLKSLKSGD